MQLPGAVAAVGEIASACLCHSEDGQDLLEYALLVGLIALVAFGAVTRVGDTVNQVLWVSIANNF
jgi:Flp pilus assembly pilin Flp